MLPVPLDPPSRVCAGRGIRSGAYTLGPQNPEPLIKPSKSKGLGFRVWGLGFRARKQLSPEPEIPNRRKSYRKPLDPWGSLRFGFRYHGLGIRV